MTESDGEFGETKTFDAGSIMYRQNAESEGVYLLLEGCVEIWHEHEGEVTLIATIGEGELLGEVSAIENVVHSVTAKTLRDTKCIYIPSPAFRKSFSNPLVRQVVRTMAARLKSSYEAKNSTNDPEGISPAARKVKVPIIEAGSRMVASCLTTQVQLKEFPFTVGAIATAAHQCTINSKTLMVPLGHVAEIANRHFEIIRRDGTLWVRDMGSPQGTVVNGEALSRYGLSATTKLRYGENLIAAGGPESPIRFKVILPAS